MIIFGRKTLRQILLLRKLFSASTVNGKVKVQIESQENLWMCCERGKVLKETVWLYHCRHAETPQGIYNPQPMEDDQEAAV